MESLKTAWREILPWLVAAAVVGVILVEKRAEITRMEADRVSLIEALNKQSEVTDSMRELLAQRGYVVGPLGDR
jgi:hypothetical protein